MTNETLPIQADIHAILTCPVCETQQEVLMPLEGFQHYYKCTNADCASDLAPLEGKDCVFCSYADKPCPQKQINPQMNEKQLQSLI